MKKELISKSSAVEFLLLYVKIHDTYTNLLHYAELFQTLTFFPNKKYFTQFNIGDLSHMHSNFPDQYKDKARNCSKKQISCSFFLSILGQISIIPILSKKHRK